MKKELILAACLLARTTLIHSQTISNPWSGVTGDRGNMVGFAFRADAGTFPDSVTPAGSLGAQLTLNGVTFLRPNDTQTPVFGTGARQLTDANTPVFLDIYTGYDAGAFSGYVGSSSSSVIWADTTPDQPFSLAFASLTLQSNTKYWFVFSEDGLEGEISNFRAKLNTAGDDLTPGAGKGYLVGDTAQAITQAGALQDWAFAYTVNVVPEPTAVSLVLVGLLGCWLRRRI